MFYYSRDRSGVHPAKQLAGYTGVLQADAYPGYDALYKANREPGPIAEAACWAHARRPFYKDAQTGKSPIAITAVAKMDAIFAAEREINRHSAAGRLAYRAVHAAPLVAQLETWLRATYDKLSRKSDLAKAINYMLCRWDSFTRFLHDGRICMTNNAAERMLRTVAIGRRNWTFAGSDRGGQRAAAMYTLIQTCRLNPDLSPQQRRSPRLARRRHRQNAGSSTDPHRRTAPLELDTNRPNHQDQASRLSLARARQIYAQLSSPNGYLFCNGIPVSPSRLSRQES